MASQFAPGLHFCGARPCSTRDGRLCVAHSTRFVWVWHRPAYVLGNRTLRTDGVRVLARRPHGQGLVPAIRVSVYPVSTLRLRVTYVRTGRIGTTCMVTSPALPACQVQPRSASHQVTCMVRRCFAAGQYPESKMPCPVPVVVLPTRAPTAVMTR